VLLHAVRLLAQDNPVTPESNVVINYLSPGGCETELMRERNGVVLRLMMPLLRMTLLRTAEQGSRTYVDAVKPDIGVETHGKFLWDCTIVP
jgi:hypothetical protein